METKLSEYIKENTISGEYAKNSALIVGKVLGVFTKLGLTKFE